MKRLWTLTLVAFAMIFAICVTTVPSMALPSFDSPCNLCAVADAGDKSISSIALIDDVGWEEDDAVGFIETADNSTTEDPMNHIRTATRAGPCCNSKIILNRSFKSDTASGDELGAKITYKSYIPVLGLKHRTILTT